MGVCDGPGLPVPPAAWHGTQGKPAWSAACERKERPVVAHDQLIAEAGPKTGLEDFGQDSFVWPGRCASAAEEPGSTSRQAALRELIVACCQRLQVENWYGGTGDRREQIERPLFGLGTAADRSTARRTCWRRTRPTGRCDWEPRAVPAAVHRRRPRSRVSAARRLREQSRPRRPRSLVPSTDRAPMPAADGLTSGALLPGLSRIPSYSSWLLHDAYSPRPTPTAPRLKLLQWAPARHGGSSVHPPAVPRPLRPGVPDARS